MKQTFTKLGGALFALLFLATSSAKAQTTLASWDFTKVYSKTSTDGTNAYYTATETTVSENGSVTNFSTETPFFYPASCVGTSTNYTISGGGSKWKIGAPYESLYSFQLSSNPINSLDDVTNASTHQTYYEISFPTTGYNDIKFNMNFSYSDNENAPVVFVVSIDGGSTWVKAGEITSPGYWWVSSEYNNNAIAVANQANVKLRILGRNTQTSKYWGIKTFSITGNALDPAKSSITFSKPADVEGIAPTPQSIDINTSFTIPQNYTLYKEGYTLTGWTDGETTFNVGSTYTMTKTFYELTPIFTPNSKSLDDRTEAVTVKWDLRHNNGVPVIAWEKNSGILVSQATINGTTIDVKMAINATDGKFDIVSRGDYCQINPKTIVSIPSTPNVEITIDAWYNTYDYLIGGNAVDQDVAKTVYTYTGSDNPVAIKFVNSAFFNYIQATYPAPETITITPAKEFTTFCSTSALNFTAVDGLEAYVVTGSTNTTITLAKVTDVPASTGLILKKTGSAASYNVPVGTATTLSETNKLVGVTTATTFNEGDYILSNGTFIRGTAGTLAAGKAYLPAANVTAGAHEMLLDFGGTTGIHQIESAKQRVEGYYNLAGQRVAQPRKGLYIVNGKKVVIK